MRVGTCSMSRSMLRSLSSSLSTWLSTNLVGTEIPKDLNIQTLTKLYFGGNKLTGKGDPGSTEV